MTTTCGRSVPIMGTIVTIDVVCLDAGKTDATTAIDSAFSWFHEVERVCNRFDPDSELRRLSDHVHRAIPASDILFAAVEFALAVAAETGGAFDPTVGRQMETLGFNRDYRTGAPAATTFDVDGEVDYQDVVLDPVHRTITNRRPLLLDLGAVVKGLAIDLAARELKVCEHFAIDAGGDLFVSGLNAHAEPWSVGIRHPRRDGEVIERLRVSNVAVCTSGDYERKASDGAGHHIVDPRVGPRLGPRVGQSADAVASATVIAPTAMVADALATAAFVLGPDEGMRLLERHGVEGVIFTPALVRTATAGIRSETALAILPDA